MKHPTLLMDETRRATNDVNNCHTNCFGRVQIILVRLKLHFSGLIFLIWTCPKWFGPDQNELDQSKTISTRPKWFGPIEGQGISEFHLKLPIFPYKICYLFWSGFEGYWLRIKRDCFRCDQISILKKAIEPNLKKVKNINRKIGYILTCPNKSFERTEKKWLGSEKFLCLCKLFKYYLQSKSRLSLQPKL